jgi:hypothetical protein
MFSINQALFSGGRKKFNDLISAPSPESEKPFDPGKAAGAPLSHGNKVSNQP